MTTYDSDSRRPGWSAKLTATEYRAIPEGPPWVELIDGCLVEEPSPSGAHQDAIGLLYSLILPWTRSRKSGLIRFAPFDVYLSEHDVLQPDLLFVAAERLSIVHDDGVHGAPDWVAEVLSPSTARRDLEVKRAIYARSGVTELWLMDPSLCEVMVFRLAEGAANPLRVHRSGDVLKSIVFPGLEIAVSDIFGGATG